MMGVDHTNCKEMAVEYFKEYDELDWKIFFEFVKERLNGLSCS